MPLLVNMEFLQIYLKIRKNCQVNDSKINIYGFCIYRIIP